MTSILMKLVNGFLNKFVAKSCERLAPHKNADSTLPFDLLENETAEFIIAAVISSVGSSVGTDQ